MWLLSRSLLLFSVLLCATPQVYSQDGRAEFRLYHRAINPNLPVTQWTDLGTVLVPRPSSISPLGTPATFTPSVSLVDDLSKFAENIDPGLEESLYQITIERAGMREAGWPVSVMKGVSYMSSDPVVELMVFSVSCRSQRLPVSPFTCHHPESRLRWIT